MKYQVYATLVNWNRHKNRGESHNHSGQGPARVGAAVERAEKKEAEQACRRAATPTVSPVFQQRAPLHQTEAHQHQAPTRASCRGRGARKRAGVGALARAVFAKIEHARSGEGIQGAAGVRHGPRPRWKPAAGRPVPRASRAPERAAGCGRCVRRAPRAGNAARTHKGNTPIRRNTVNWTSTMPPLASRGAAAVAFRSSAARRRCTMIWSVPWVAMVRNAAAD